MKLHVITLKKHYGCNVAGETCTFPPEVAAHILKDNGGEEHGVVEAGKERWDFPPGKPEEGRVVPINAPAAPVPAKAATK